VTFRCLLEKEAGVQLHKLQQGFEPSDWKPMPAVGAGVREIRIHDEAGAFRVLYVVKAADTICVLHAFKKKASQKTLKRNIELAASRYKQI
jgi:phage-related protein